MAVMENRRHTFLLKLATVIGATTATQVILVKVARTVAIFISRSASRP